MNQIFIQFQNEEKSLQTRYTEKITLGKIIRLIFNL